MNSLHGPQGGAPRGRGGSGNRRGARALQPRDLALAGLMAAVTAVLAYVRLPVPLSPVPVSGQTLGVMLAGALLGARLGALSQGVYVLLGAMGLPVFAGGMGGLAVLAGPTGGYLIGFILGAYVTGRLVEGVADVRVGRWLLAFGVGGVLAVYVPGVLQLALVMNLPLSQAVALGVVPFLVGDVVKVLVSTVIMQGLQAVPVRRAAPGRN